MTRASRHRIAPLAATAVSAALLLAPGAALAQAKCDSLCRYTTQVMKEAPRCFAALRGAPRPGSRPRQYSPRLALEGADCVVIGYFVHCRLGEYKIKANAERHFEQALASVKAALAGDWTFSEENDKVQRQTIAMQGGTHLKVSVEMTDFSEMQEPIDIGVTFDARECAAKGPCANTCP